MSITQRQFGVTEIGKDIMLYTIKNKNGYEASVTNLGACLVNLIVANDRGEFRDVTLGYDEGESYLLNSCFFGAVIGRSANRIAGAKFTIDGVDYHIAVNENDNNLHTEMNKGMHKVLWKSELGEDCVKFTYRSPDMENGFPGNFDVAVTYTLTDDNALIIAYEGVSDKKTIINMTNHAYFNLAGHDSGSIEKTKLQINASYYTPVVPGAIPTGELVEVAGTPLDFTKEKVIGKDIGATDTQLLLVGGYDHNFAVDNYDGSEKLIAVAKADGVKMEVYSDLPGVQFYAGNFIKNHPGKKGAQYGFRTGFCLETQYFPNSANEPKFKKPEFAAGEAYKTRTIYKFS